MSEVERKISKDEYAHLPEEIVDFRALKPHPDNYQSHPPDQIEELQASIRKHGIFRNIVVSQDDFVLAGHGMVEAALGMSITGGPARRSPYNHDTLAALELLVADNETARRAERDDRKLSTVLKSIYDEKGEEGLEGTGYTSQMLANLVMVTRPASEIADHNEAAHWVGMPDYEPEKNPLRVIVSFESAEEREEFLGVIGAYQGSMKDQNSRGVISLWWPIRKREDPGSLMFEG